jgi:hypothetical protein
MPVSIPATSTTRSAVSSSSPLSGFAAAFPVDDFALTPAERRLFEALDRHGVRYMLLGMSAALLEGAPVATQDLDMWFESISDERIRQAARDSRAGNRSLGVVGQLWRETPHLGVHRS